jgi:hypothetical protein
VISITQILLVMRHFETKAKALKFRDEQRSRGKNVKVFKKLKGHRNRLKKPFVVGTEFEWLNLI